LRSTITNTVPRLTALAIFLASVTKLDAVTQQKYYFKNFGPTENKPTTSFQPAKITMQISSSRVLGGAL
jgi:hypothetical protein